MRVYAFMTLLCGLCFLITLIQTQASFDLNSSNGKKKIRSPEYRQGEAVVQLKKQKDATDGAGGHLLTNKSLSAATHQLLVNLGKKYAVSVRNFDTDPSLLLVRANNSISMTKLLKDIEENEEVAFAEPNYIYRISQVDEATLSTSINNIYPNDPAFSNNWGLLNTGQKNSKGIEGIAGRDIGATKAWSVGTDATNVVVAVIDTGVDYEHEDLKRNIFENSGEIPDNGKDDDDNGFIDDVHGWNFEKKSNDPMDDNRHGTHCAGTIAADGNNGVGTSGVAWRARILPIKFLSATGSGMLSDAIESIKYATSMHANIMSNSWGGGGFSRVMLEAVQEARNKGILFVAAAGNDGTNNDVVPTYPANFASDNVISVAATNHRDEKAPFSNYGQKNVHLAAPGVEIYSTLPTSKGSYGILSGTSMACPHVSGAAALLWSLNSKMDYQSVKERLLATVDPIKAMQRKSVSGGRLNISNAIQNYVPPRNEPPADGWKSMVAFYETKHPYESNTSKVFEISQPGARFMRVHFDKIATEANYDVIRIRSSAGEILEEISGERSDYLTTYSEGDKIFVEFTSDGSEEGFGFTIDRYDFVERAN